MNTKLREIFNQIHAEEELKDDTKEFLVKKMQGYNRWKAGKCSRYVYAACVCILITLLGGRWLYFTPTVEISIDINPSIELSINRFDQVVCVNSFNEDGQELSEELDIKFKSYTEAIEQILNNNRIAALLSDNEIMTITVIGPDEKQSAKILSNVEAYTAEQRNTYCYFASSNEVAMAHETGLSYGKYRAFLEVQLLVPDITPETIQNMSMREIRELVDSLSIDNTNENPSHNNWGNGPHGYGNGHGGGYGNGR